jgi:D-alanyl-D-alanine carboxypeptidase (penicillin-binding protein 5/6)
VVIVATAPWHGSTASRPAADGKAGGAAKPLATAPAKPTAKPTPKAPVNPITKVNAAITLKAPGSTGLRWPSVGQAAISVVGVGTVGHSGGYAQLPTASVAKAMTAYLIVKDHPLVGNAQGPTLTVTPAEAAEFPHQVALGQSLVPVRPGEHITERQALQALMLASADNMAQILGRWDAGSVPAFLTKMNATAQQLGMTHTHYTDPSGYEQHTVSTAFDQMKLANAAMKLTGFRQVVGQQTAVIPVAGRIQNFNKLLREPGVTGIKTGSMSAAGGCLLFTANTTVGGRTVSIAGTVLGQRSAAIGDLNQAFVSSHNILASLRQALKPITIVHKGQVVATVPGTKSSLVAMTDVTIPGWGGMAVPSKVTAAVAPTTVNGAHVGTLTVGSISYTPLALHK